MIQNVGTSDLEVMLQMATTILSCHCTPQSVLASRVSAGDETITVANSDDFSTAQPVKFFDGTQDVMLPISEDWDGSTTLVFDWGGFATPGFLYDHTAGSVVGANLYDRNEQPSAAFLSTGWPVIYLFTTSETPYIRADPLFRESAFSVKLIYQRSLVQKRPLGGADRLMNPFTWATMQEGNARLDMKAIADALFDNWFLEDEAGYQHSLGYGDHINPNAALATILWGNEIIDNDNATFEASATISLRGRWQESLTA